MNRKGFTLVEILIVVIILGILAAIVIPQFTEASNDARSSALASDLQTVRSQVELYKVQHLEVLPTAAIVAELTNKTNISGGIEGVGGAVGPFSYGPYLQKFPTNPYTATNDVTTDNTAPGGGETGWNYNTTTGKFSPDDTAHAAL